MLRKFTKRIQICCEGGLLKALSPQSFIELSVRVGDRSNKDIKEDTSSKIWHNEELMMKE